MTYLDYKLYNHIIKYDKRLQVIEDKILRKATDNHGQLDILLDSSGKLHLIGGGHTDDNNYYYVQTNTTSLTFNEFKITPFMTYPKMFEYNNFIYIIYRDSLQQHSNYDRWVLVKTPVTSTTIDFSSKEIITVTGNESFLPGYGNTSNLIGNKLFFNCNWYTISIDSSDSGFIIYKNLDNGLWYNVRNQQVSLPFNTSNVDFTGKEFRQSSTVEQNGKQYFINSHLLTDKVEVYEINNSLQKIENSLPQSIFVVGLKSYNNILYCLGTDKYTKNIYLFRTKDGFKTVDKTLISNCGKSPYWSSATFNIIDNKYFVRVLVNYSNLMIERGAI